ncbi:MAG: GAF domain-containing sensor histidine kinase, partial [Chitinispirillaceae bacterium]|nr:GAF domain-containing sensor histidine kinase [Chitinispirillaceae bacterium]
FINRNVYENFEPFAMSFEGKEVPVEDVPIFKDLINKVNEIHSLQYGGEAVLEDESEIETSFIRSDMCIPLNWRDKYLGYVYLVNDNVRGLFGEYAQKAAMILAAHAGILLENSYLINRQRKFNEELQQKVKEQTEDIKQKNIQLEEANLKLVESERMKGILSGTIVHDINNYASGIDGIISNIVRRSGDDPKLKRLLSVAKDACSDIMNLTSNLLDIAKMDEGRLVIKEELIDYSFIVQLVSKFEASALFEEKGITTRIIPPVNEFVISADVYLFQRLLQNLYNNAAKYAPKGSYVELSFEAMEKENIITLFNSGPPIPESEKEAIFDKYARIDKKTSQYSKGLGLFFCKMVMNAHGGRIWLETDEKGNYFKMAFPVKKEKLEDHRMANSSIRENRESLQLT